MRLEEFSIRLDQPHDIIFSGDLVSGMVTIRLGKETRIAGVVIHVRGEAKTHWSRYNNDSVVDFCSSETYVDKRIIVFGSDELLNPSLDEFDLDSDCALVHPAGSFHYQFSVPVGATAPSSFEGEKGHVRYWCQAFILRIQGPHVIRQPFTVIHHYNLNMQPELAAPLTCSSEDLVSGCCFEIGHAAVQLHLCGSGFVPGQNIAFHITLQNQSESKVKAAMILYLEQHVTYTGYSYKGGVIRSIDFSTKKNQFLLFEHMEKVPRHSSKAVNNWTVLPPMAPSKLDGCTFINVQYVIKLKVDFGYTKLVLEKDVVIGTIPLALPDANAWHDSLAAAFTGLRLESRAVPDAPPTYDECVAKQPPPPYKGTAAECQPLM